MYYKLKETRKERDYTIKEMSEQLGISKPFYCQIENQQRRLTYDMALRIAAIFNMRPDALFYDDFINEKNEEK